MLIVEEALERVLGFFEPLDVEERPLIEARGQVLAEDVVSRFDIPPLDNSAMDGYAVQAASVAGASEPKPVSLTVIGSVAAGQLPDGQVGPGTAIRIMTGAPVPAGADAVVPFEDTSEGAHKGTGALSRISIYTEVERNTNVRPAGQDVRSGERILARGIVLRSAEVGVLASLGYEVVKVIRRPTVAILATGDELVEPGAVLAPGQIFNSNSSSVASEVARAGAKARVLGIARDDIDALNAKIAQGARLRPAHNHSRGVQGRLRYRQGRSCAERHDRVLVRPDASSQTDRVRDAARPQRSRGTSPGPPWQPGECDGRVRAARPPSHPEDAGKDRSAETDG